jgi:hypothetical protein
MDAHVCPACQRKLPPPTPVRHLKCWACGGDFDQSGPGRRRVVCHKPECALKRRTYRKQGGAALDRMDP